MQITMSNLDLNSQGFFWCFLNMASGIEEKIIVHECKIGT
jgi:hypothetical protein